MGILKINDAEIKAIEKLIIEGGNFDQERLEFIKDINTSLDLVACPGSGKTTCLIAKIILLANRMPFEDGRGICILTHTNVAINEIKQKLGTKANILFRYPNYFGTIQSFINKFLAIPFWAIKKNTRNIVIDELIYYKKISQKEKKFPWIKGFQQQDYKNINYFKLNNEGFIYSYRFDIIDGKLAIRKKMGGEIEKFNAPRKRKVDFTEPEKDKIKDWFKKFKSAIHNQDGIFCYDDMYFFSKLHLLSHPQFIEQFSNRFNYVFLDEMQDTTTWQLEILDSIFSNKANVVLQKIGDPNQEIFDLDSDTSWKPDINNRERVKKLNLSLRFGKEIAERIKFVCVSDVSTTFKGSKIGSLIPQIILYKDETIGDVLEKFCELIYKSNLHQDKRKIFKAIGWRSKTDANKLSINHYFPNFNKEQVKKKAIYGNLFSYLIKQETSNDTYNQIICAFIQLLELAQKKNENRRFTKSSFIKFFVEFNEKEYYNFLNYLSIWVFELMTTYSHNKKVWDQISAYIENIFCSLFQIEFENVKQFVFDKNIEIELPQYLSNCKYSSKNIPEIDIDIDTIHGVKGETHTATLLLETYFEGKTESQYLFEQLKGNPYIKKKKGGVYLEKCLKMSHVTMSRPTHLLCFAVNIKNIAVHLEEIKLSEKKPNGWILNEDLL